MDRHIFTRLMNGKFHLIYSIELPKCFFCGIRHKKRRASDCTRKALKGRSNEERFLRKLRRLSFKRFYCRQTNNLNNLNNRKLFSYNIIYSYVSLFWNYSLISSVNTSSSALLDKFYFDTQPDDVVRNDLNPLQTEWISFPVILNGSSSLIFPEFHTLGESISSPSSYAGWKHP